jgi:serine/threonine-protein kinase mTOR
MEVSGIEGTFRTTCENVMQVLRTNRDSVMAMMEVRVFAFI